MKRSQRFTFLWSWGARGDEAQCKQLNSCRMPIRTPGANTRSDIYLLVFSMQITSNRTLNNSYIKQSEHFSPCSPSHRPIPIN